MAIDRNQAKALAQARQRQARELRERRKALEAELRRRVMREQQVAAEQRTKLRRVK